MHHLLFPFIGTLCFGFICTLLILIHKHNKNKIKKLINELKRYDQSKNYYVDYHDEYMINKPQIKINKINTNEINKDINIDIRQPFTILQMSSDDICKKIYNINPNRGKSFNEICIERNIKSRDFITDMRITKQNTHKFSKIIHAIYEIHFNFNCEYVQDDDSFNKRDIKKLKNSKFIVDTEKLKLFIYTGAFQYYLLLVNENKHKTLGQICNHCYRYFYKYKDETKDLSKIRCLTNYDPIAKIICRYFHYMINNTVMKNFDNDVIRTITSRNNKTSFSKIINTIFYFKTRLFNFKDKVVLLDISKAFDNVSRDVLSKVLTKFMIPKYIINYILYIFSVNEKRTGNSSIHGIQQGNPLSSILFDMYHYTIYKHIINQLSDTKMMYFVDDIALYYSKDVPNETIYSNIAKIIKIYKDFGLEINERKTKYINIEESETIKAYKTQYLGVPISNKFDDIIEILNKNYGKELLSLLDDKYVKRYLLKYGNIMMIQYLDKLVTINKAIKYLSMSISWRLMYFYDNTKPFENELKHNNGFLFDIYQTRNNKLMELKCKSSLLNNNNVSILDKHLLTSEINDHEIKHSDIPYINFI